MKKILISFLVCFFCISIQLVAQAPTKYIKVFFKNNGILPRKFSFITYSPGESGNRTVADFIFPGFSKKLVLLPGTKVYLANQKEVAIVMSGKRIDAEKPFYTVQATDNNRVIDLRQ